MRVDGAGGRLVELGERQGRYSAHNPDLQRFMAKRMGATTIELKSSHVSLISYPKEIADLILKAAGRG